MCAFVSIVLVVVSVVKSIVFTSNLVVLWRRKLLFVQHVSLICIAKLSLPLFIR